MKKPVDIYLDSLDWKELPSPDGAYGDVPYATHEGVLDFGGIPLRVYQLSNGQRVIHSDDMHELLQQLPQS